MDYVEIHIIHVMPSPVLFGVELAARVWESITPTDQEIGPLHNTTTTYSKLELIHPGESELQRRHLHASDTGSR